MVSFRMLARLVPARFSALGRVALGRVGSRVAMRALTLAFVSVSLMTGLAKADQVMDKIEVETTPDKAWAAIGDFCGIKNWHPSVASCELTGGGVPRVRILILRDGTKVVEKEANWNDRGRAYSYMTVEGPLPITSAMTMIKVLPRERGKLDLLWTSSFKPVGSATEAKQAVAEFLAVGLRSLKAKLETP